MSARRPIAQDSGLQEGRDGGGIWRRQVVILSMVCQLGIKMMDFFLLLEEKVSQLLTRSINGVDSFWHLVASIYAYLASA